MRKFYSSPVLHLFTAIILTGTATPAWSADAPNVRKTKFQQPSENTMQQHPYVGMWVTDDGRVRHGLLPDNRYDEARGSRESAYRGRYEVTGTHIEYWDDTGFTADGDFVDDNTLHHGGMVLRRK
ncbi:MULTISPECIES: Atu4866 domain-containing protein [unclassified Rhizobium]|uniref:Atu4866 domain-containing protein n=1 Tax=unclassified Rhizobium TaxID=2613769 RepID=UPI001C82F9C9|nr:MULTISPECIES: Atu4866 domain-containing protein [unclassified Rhizobium]MBX5220360.1 Atu4866 domain-containing protein [Rhizobium sp. NLR8a]MBX5225827.1 Atu4866 domain-containing protein [Rhizobium sp. NLR9b]MBX5232057.1 Atu4866 domain-containing protein [Rhizobium sp. NLR4a]MBX5237365.1 Atu4866 domain-containing protein [Rhizobium sp. NLR22b]MBX5286500.1 Atu4866 domain-containing protein [Rhizobium sp. NLR10b]